MTAGSLGTGPRGPRQSGQASLLSLGVLAALLVGTLILFGFGQALGSRSKHRRARRTSRPSPPVR